LAVIARLIFLPSIGKLPALELIWSLLVFLSGMETMDVILTYGKIINRRFNHGFFIAHNALFDLKCCQLFLGIRPNNIFCTMIASHLLDENRESHSLKALASSLLRIPQDQIMKWGIAEKYGRHSEIFYQYAQNDSIWTYHLWKIFAPQLRIEGLTTVFEEIEMPFLQVAADMELNGVLIDQDKLVDLEERVVRTLIEVEDKMFASVGMSIKEQLLFGGDSERILPMNLNSSPQLEKLIEKKCKIPLTERNRKSGKKKCDQKVLQGLVGRHPFIGYLLDYKKLQKLYTAFIMPAWERIDEDGRIRPSIGITRTGRTSNREPNLQQLPRLSKKYPDINYRSVFIAPKDSYLVGADYAGQELRGLGVVSGEEKIKEAFDKNWDLHLFTANFIFDLGIPDEGFVVDTPGYKKYRKKYEGERYKAKNGANFPIIYGTTPVGISYRMRVPKQEAKQWIDKFFALYPKVKKAIEQTKKEIREKGFVCTLFGRRRRFPNYNDLPPVSKGRASRQAFNAKIQGLGADQIKIAAIKVRQAGLKVIMIVHDEIVVETKNPTRDKEILKQCMENAIALSIKFQADCKVGKSYAEIK